MNLVYVAILLLVRAGSYPDMVKNFVSYIQVRYKRFGPVHSEFYQYLQSGPKNIHTLVQCHETTIPTNTVASETYWLVVYRTVLSNLILISYKVNFKEVHNYALVEFTKERSTATVPLHHICGHENVQAGQKVDVLWHNKKYPALLLLSGKYVNRQMHLTELVCKPN